MLDAENVIYRYLVNKTASPSAAVLSAKSCMLKFIGLAVVIVLLAAV